MLEIMLIVVLCQKMGAILRNKGWTKPFWMQVLVVVTYLGSMFIGSVVYATYVFITEGEAALENLGLSAYLAAYVGAILGVGTLFLATKLIKTKESSPPPLNVLTPS